MVLGMSSSLSRIWWYHDHRSNFEKYLVPCNSSNSSSIIVIGNLSLMVILLRALKSIHMHNNPSLLQTKSTREKYELTLSYIILASNISWTNLSILFSCKHKYHRIKCWVVNLLEPIVWYDHVNRKDLILLVLKNPLYVFLKLFEVMMVLWCLIP